MKKFFEVYARGVNAYLYRHRDKLPMDLAESGYKPEYWKPEDSVLVFCLLNFGLSQNLQEEVAALLMAQKVGSDKLAWLLPIYPDEVLPFDEVDKLKGLKLGGNVPGLAALERATQPLAALTPPAWRLPTTGPSPAATRAAASRSWPTTRTCRCRCPRTGISCRSAHRSSRRRVSPSPASRRGGGLQRQARLGHDHGHGRQPGPLSRAGASRRLAADVPGRRQMAAGPRAPRDLLRQGRAADPRDHFRNRNGPLLNSVLGERKHPLQPLQLGSGYGGAEDHAAGSRSHAGRLLRPVPRAVGGPGLRGDPRFAPRSIWCSPTSRALAGR